jgi:glutamyl-tRNA reductase
MVFLNMMNSITKICNFYVAGINYKKADSETRGRFAIGDEQYESILQRAGNTGIGALFILSTCNRTEIYGIAQNSDELVDLLCGVTVGKKKEFTTDCYIKTGTDAVEHLFRVAAGLDSQILGDYEIVGQFKKAVKFAKQRGFINSFLEQLHNTVLQASKQIKNQTNLSKGTTSVSFAAVQLIKKRYEKVTDHHILLVGAGKIGQCTCKNLKDYFGGVNITLVNRSPESAKVVAAQMQVKHADFAELRNLINEADIIIVATGAAMPIIAKDDLEHSAEKLVIDLSVPNNVDPAAGTLPNIKLVNIDDLSLVSSETLEKRQKDIHHAQKINTYFIESFEEWCAHRKNGLLVNSIKKKLTSICLSQLLVENNVDQTLSYEQEQRIQHVLNEAAGKLKITNQAGCNYLEALNDFLSPQFC